MKFETKKLATAIGMAVKFIGKNIILEVTQCIQIKCTENEVTVSSTNLEIYFDTMYLSDYATLKDVEYFIIDSMIIKSIMSCKEPVIELTNRESERHSGKIATDIIIGESTITIDPVFFTEQDMPVLNFGNHKPVAVCDKIFIDELFIAGLFCTTDQIRQAMTCVNISNENNSITLVSSDGHVLFVSSKIPANELAEFKANIPMKTISLMKSLFAKHSYIRIVSSEKTNQYIGFVFEKDGYESTVYCRKVDQPYPDFRFVLENAKAKNKGTLRLKKSQFITQLLELKRLGDPATQQIKFNVLEDTASSENIGESIKYKTKIKMNPNNFVLFDGFAFSARVLLSLKYFSGDDILMHCSEAHKPFFCHDNNRTFLLMPVVIY